MMSKSSLWKRCGKILHRCKTSQLLLGGFALLIILGSLVLTLPVCSRSGTFTPYLDALFTATTSVCVTGLVTVSTATHWSLFGQMVILILVQLGGLGVIAIMIMAMVLMHRRIGLKNRIFIQQSYGLHNMTGLVTLVRKIVKGTLVVEFVGFLCYLPVFVPKNGAKGVWDSLFLSVSAFCNAGMDTLGDNSLSNYVGNYWVNLVTMMLIILGGLGFVVWWEAIYLIKEKKRKKLPIKKVWQKGSLHFKIVLTTTVLFIAAGAVIIFIFDYHNPGTLGPLSLPQKIVAAIFQSVTTRTAGFFTISQTELRDSSALVSMLLMFIGGSPAGTAGGIKTVTIAIIFFAIMAEAKGYDDVKVFHRSIAFASIRKALAILFVSFVILCGCTVLLCAIEPVDFMRILYEATSAIGTVGLSKDLTPNLTLAGKLIIIIMMYCGRIGPITVVTTLIMRGRRSDRIRYPEENIMLG